MSIIINQRRVKQNKTIKTATRTKSKKQELEIETDKNMYALPTIYIWPWHKPYKCPSSPEYCVSGSVFYMWHIVFACVCGLIKNTVILRQTCNPNNGR